MPFHPHCHRSARRFSKLQRVLTMAAATSTLSLSLLAAPPSDANAAGFSNLNAFHSGYNVAVREGSTSAGAQIIQWPADGGTEQEWQLLGGDVDYSYLFENLNSGLCITTDGTPGDTLTQQPCDSGHSGEEWERSDQVWGAWGFGAWGVAQQLYNAPYGLCMDVYGDSTDPGAVLDAWSCKGINGTNQLFTSSLFAGM